MAGLLRNQSRARIDAGFILSLLVRLAIAVATAIATALSAWLRFVDIQRASIQLLTVEAAYGCDRLVLRRHLHKRKTSWLPAVIVGDNFDGCDFAEALEGMA